MDNYEILKTLGKGSYGKVMLAKKKGTEEKYAIKKVNFELLSEKEKEKALDEVSLLSSMHHPNITAYKESFQDKKNLYIVMEYIDGGDLEKLINKRGAKRFEEDEILFIFVQIVVALCYIHKSHILHRDLKPQNIFLTSFQIVKLGDFGVAKSLSSTFSLANTVIGTPYYLSPEVWNGKKYNSKTDIWSLGCILYEMCTLHKPFDGNNPTELFQAVLKGNYDPIPPRYSGELIELVTDMLQQDPSLRPTAQQIINMSFIQNAKQRLIEKNNTIIQNSPIKRPIGLSRGKLLSKELLSGHIQPPKQISKQSPPKWAQDAATDRKQKPSFGQDKEFEDDFEDDFDDDFEDFDEDNEKYEEEEEESDDFNLLQEMTTMLIETKVQNTEAPNFCGGNSDSIAYKVESLRVQLEDELGEDLLTELYQNLMNMDDDPQAAKYVHDYEKIDKDSVRHVRDLIMLEQSLDSH